jgi:hypothetical protein
MSLDTKTDWLSVSRNVTSTLNLTYQMRYPCGGGFEYLHRDPASRRRRRKGKSQIWGSKICHESQGSPTRERLRWRGPAAYTKDRPVLSSERALQKNQTVNCQRVINIWSWTPDEARHQDLLIDWPSVPMWLSRWLCLKTDADSQKTVKRPEEEATESFGVLSLFGVTQCYSYSKIKSVRINYNSAWRTPNKPSVKSRTHALFVALPSKHRTILSFA